jgi:colanic acid/amylovoran biosynthesis glycosyltransferase
MDHLTSASGVTPVVSLAPQDASASPSVHPQANALVNDRVCSGETAGVAASPTASLSSSSPPATPARCRVAYMMSRFPKITETFILFEMLAVERLGVEVEVYPLLKARNTATHPEGATVWGKFLELLRPPARQAAMHPEAKPFVARAHYSPLISPAILWANLVLLALHPLRYCGALATFIRTNLGSLNYLLGGLVLFPKTVYLARHMQRNGVTHLHAHFGNHPAAMAWVVHRLVGIPYSFTAHGADIQVDQHMLREKVMEASFVATISNYNVEFLVEHCGEDARRRIRVVRCGVDTEVFHPQPKTAAAADQDLEAGRERSLRIVCVGTLYEVKGHAYLIEACELLAQSGFDFECRLVGDGPLLSELRERVQRAGLAERVLFLGRRTRDEIAALLRESDVLVAPSIPTSSGRREGIPVVLMEAMASGLAVVGSDISGIPELIDHGVNGQLCPPRDAKALADQLRSLAADRETLRKMGEAARAKVLREYHQPTNAARLIRLFQQQGEESAC